MYTNEKIEHARCLVNAARSYLNSAYADLTGEKITQCVVYDMIDAVDRAQSKLQEFSRVESGVRLPTHRIIKSDDGTYTVALLHADGSVATTFGEFGRYFEAKKAAHSDNMERRDERAIFAADKPMDPWSGDENEDVRDFEGMGY